MHHDSFRNDHTAGPRASEFSDAVPRGNVLRSTEPVVAPVAAPMASDRDVRTTSDIDRTNHPTTNPTVGTTGSTMSGAKPVYTPDTTRSGRLDADERRVIDDPDAGSPSVREVRHVGGVRDKRFSIGATFLGWAVASFFSIIFTVAILSLIGGAAAGVGGDQVGVVGGDPFALGVLTFVGVLVAMFLAYLVGGYAAGRIAHWDGAKHGAGVPVWTILFALIGIVAGAFLGPRLAGFFTVGLPAFDAGTVTAYTILGVLLMLAADFAGAILGGILGARGDQRYESGAVERRRTLRGRPL